MKWLNIEIAQLRAPEYLAHEPPQRAAWVQVLAWCCEQENGGRIVGAAGWGDRRWMQTCGVTKAEVRAAAGLLTFDGDDLVVFRYPTDKERIVREDRKNGAKGGAVKSQAKTEAAKDNGARGGRPATKPITQGITEGETQGITEGETQGITEGETKGITEAETQRNGMEGKGREDNTPPLPPVEPGGGIVEAEKSPPEPTKPADPPPKSPRPDGPAAVHDREVPEFLRTAEFASDTIAALFNDWLDERRQRRKYATARACREALKKLSAYPPAVQEAALRDSIANSWQGVFPEKQRPPPPDRRPIQHLDTTIDDRRALAEHLQRPQRF